jgi:hypothetical protein
MSGKALGTTGCGYHVPPARELRGTREETLADLDELIHGLIRLRQIIAVRRHARYQLTERTGLGLRYERLDDGGLFDGVAQVLQEAACSPRCVNGCR